MKRNVANMTQRLAIQKPCYIQELSSFPTWLYLIAYHVFYDYIRSRKDIGQQIDIYRALATLKEMERTCITLSIWKTKALI